MPGLESRRTSFFAAPDSDQELVRSTACRVP